MPKPNLDLSPYRHPDLKLFAHIHNDSTLSASLLQGHTFEQTIGYMAYFLDGIANGALNVPGLNQRDREDLARSLQPIITSFKHTIEMSKITHQDFEGSESDSIEMDRILALITDKAFDTLSEHKRVIIPGGWAGHPITGPGHAMLYEFKVLESGELVFLVWNTGAGIDTYHHYQEDSEKFQLSSPVKAYQCGKLNDLKPQSIKALISILIQARFPANDFADSHDEHSIYSHIISQIALLSGKEVSPKDYCKYYDAPQISGTCAWKVLEAFLKNEISENIDYDLIHFEILRNSLESFLSENQHEIASSKAYQRELKFALEHFALRIKMLAKTKQLDATQQQAGLDLIARAKPLLIKDEATDEQPKPAAYDIQVDEVIHLPRNRHERFDDDEHRAFHRSADGLYSELNTPAFNDLDDLYDLINDTLDEQWRAERLSYIHKIEKVLRALPLNDDFFNQPHQVHFTQFAEALQKLTKTYIHLCKEDDSIPYPHRQVQVYSAVAFLEQMASTYFKDQGDVLKSIFSGRQISAELLSRHFHFENHQRSHYFTLTDAKDSKRLIEINKVFNKNKSTNPQIIEHYAQIITCQDEAFCKHVGMEPNGKNRIKITKEFVRNHKRYARISKKTHDEISFGLYYNSLLSYAEGYTSRYLRPSKENISDDLWKHLHFIVTQNRKTQIEFTQCALPSYECNALVDMVPIQKYMLERQFRTPIKNPNKIQLNLHAKAIDSALDLTRLLSHIGSCPRAQFVATLEFLKANASYMQDADLQNIVFAFLFEHTFFENELKVNPKAFHALLDIIESGLTFYSKDKIELPFAFYGKLLGFTRLRLQSLESDRRNINILLEKLQGIEQLAFEKIDAHFSQIGGALKTECHILSLLRVYNQFKANGGWTDEALIEFHVLNFKLANQADLLENKFLNHQVEGILNELRTHLYHHRELISKHVIQRVIAQLDIDFPTDKGFISYPHISSGHKRLDLIRAQYSDNDCASTLLPKSLYKIEAFKRFFGYDQILALKLGYGCYQFQHKGQQYRLKEYSRSFLLQKKLKLENNGPAWFELVNKPSRFKPYLELVPSTYLDVNHDVWVSEHNDVIIYDKPTQKKRLTINHHDRMMRILDEHEQPIKILLNKSLLKSNGALATLSRFECEDLIELTRDIQTDQREITLPRYDLHFIEQKINGQTRFVSNEYPGYFLTQTNRSAVPGLNNALVLAKDTAQGDYTYKTLLPKQVCFADGSTSQGYYQKHLDISNYQNIALLLRYNKSHEKSMLPQGFSMDEIEKLKQYPLSIDYRVKESHLCLNGFADNARPTSNQDAFYLAYYHLAQNQPEKALSLLRSFGHHFTGTLEELNILRMIICDLPAQDIGIDKHAKQQNTNPYHLAVQAQALSIIMQHKRQGHLLDEISIENSKGSSFEKLLHYAKLDKINEFIKEMNITADSDTQRTLLINSVCTYLVCKPYMPKAMHLSRKEELALIEELKLNDKNTFSRLFFAKVKKKSKKLKGLMKEYHSLRRKSNATKTDLEKIVKLETAINREYQILPQHIELKDQAVDLSIEAKKRSTRNQEQQPTRNQDQQPSLNLRISQLNAATPMEAIKTSCLDLFHEALTCDGLKYDLIDFLDNKLMQLAAEKMACKNIDREFDEDQLKPYSLLRSMLANEDKVLHILQRFKNVRPGIALKFYTVDGVERCSSVKAALNCIFKYQIITLEQKSLERVDAQDAFSIQSSIKPKMHLNAALPNRVDIESLDDILETLNIHLNPEQSAKSRGQRVPFQAPQTHSSDFYHHLIETSNEDYQAGQAHNTAQNALNSHYLQQLASMNVRHSLHERLTQALENHLVTHTSLEGDIVALMNRGPKDEEEQRLWQLSLEDKSRKPFTMDQAFKFFSKGDISQIIDKCKLNEDEARHLLTLTKQYLVEGCARKHYARILNLLNEIESQQDEHKQRSLIHKLGQELSLKRAYDIDTFRDILLFEYLDNKLVYQNQISMLKKLLSKDNDTYVNTVIQLIMGGGKSKVLLPLLAKIRADGTNLSILEVPAALLETNYRDLYEISNKLNQKAHMLKFNRNMPYKARDFYRLRQHLQSVVRNKEYLVTTRESIQSLELKYIDVLTNPQDDIAEWEKQIKYLDDIVNLISRQGDAIIDEIDLNLKTKDQLIYTVGDGKPSPKYVIESIVDLYQFFHKIELRQGDHTINLHDVVSLKVAKPSEQMLDAFVDKIRRELITNADSPIQTIVAALTPQQRTQLNEFLSNQSPKIPECIQALSLKDKTILAVYKEHLNRLLNISLKRKLYENFGLSKDPNKSGLAKEVAIPYVSNNTPNETAKFQNHLLTMNYTIQTHLAQPLSFYVFELMIKDFKKKLLAENDLNTYSEDPHHRVEAQLAALLDRNIDLPNLDVSDTARIRQLYDEFKDNQKVKRHCLSELILPTILSSPLTLTSNAQNHVHMYQSVVGFTGTDYNFRCFHDSIHRDNRESFGTDGQTIDHLLSKEKQHTQTHVLDSAKPEALYELIAKHSKRDQVRAIIDVGAQFKGVSNRKVANHLASFYANQQKDMDIKHILYFNDDNLLCALKVDPIPEQCHPIVLGTTDNIATKLGCRPDQYFTYYDQPHTTGTDVFQAAQTIGLVTVSEKVLLRDLLQAAMRLRQLKDSHSCELVVMDALAAEHPEIKQWDVKTILNICLNHQANTLMKAHLASGFQKIHNEARADIVKQIKDAPTLMQKIILGDAYKELLYNYDGTSLFDKFAPAESLVETKSLLKSHQSAMIDKYKECLHTAGYKVDADTLNAMRERMDLIIEKTVKICHEQQLSPIRNNADNQVVAQVEVHNELENERENQNQAYLPNYKERAYKSWSKIDLTRFEPKGFSMFGLSFMSLEKIAKSHPKPRTWQFDSSIHASENFYNTCWMPFLDKINTLKKPCFFVLNIEDNQKSTKVMITQQEAQELRPLLAKAKQPHHRHVWIETQSGIPYAGKKPNACLHDHERLMEQIMFFNADVSYLAANHRRLTWLKTETENKLDYLESDLLTYHPSKKGLIDSLKSCLMIEGPQVSQQDIVQSDSVWRFYSFNALYHRYMYPQDGRVAAHNKEDFQTLRRYYLHRMNIGTFSMGRMLEFKKDIQFSLKRVLLWLNHKAQKLFANINTKGMENYFWHKATLKNALVSGVYSFAHYATMFISFTAYLGAIGFGLGYVARSVAGLYAKQRYNTVTKVQNIDNTWELSALKAGVESRSVSGYAMSFVKPVAYLYPKAYYAGLEIGCDSQETVLCDEVKNHKLWRK